jgi:hypothetical protein
MVISGQGMGVKIEQRGDDLVFVGDCHNRPVATVRPDGIEVQSKHSSDKCENLISWEEIEEAKQKAIASNPVSS